MLSPNSIGVQTTSVDVLLHHTDEEKTLVMSKESDTLLTNLTHFPRPRGPTGAVAQKPSIRMGQM